MNSEKKTIVVSALAALLPGLLTDLIPEHLANASLQEQVQRLTDRNSGLQVHLNRTHRA